MLLSLAACGRGELPPAPTEAPAEAPTAEPAVEPTAEPTEEPAPAPTEAPDFSGLIPKTGKLCEGPIFPEPAKYLVISGEGDNFYVYDNMGELVKIFNAVEDEYAFGIPGFYGEDGICENVLISTGEKLDEFYLFGDCFYYIDEDWENESFRLRRVLDEDRNTLFEFSKKEAPELGMGGGVLHIGDRFYILNRDYEWDGDYPVRTAGDILVYDETGSLVSRLDPEPFGHIFGVFGGKYILGGVMNPDPEGEDDDFYGEMQRFDCSIFDLEGNKLMEHIKANGIDWMAIEDEAGYGGLRLYEYLEDEDGNFFDGDLNEIESIPVEYQLYGTPANQRYGCLNWIMRSLGFEAEVWDDTFVGVRLVTEEGGRGDWTFRIYNPKLASDRDNDGWSYWEYND